MRTPLVKAAVCSGEAEGTTGWGQGLSPQSEKKDASATTGASGRGSAALVSVMACL
jgi:hypothetical protein